MLDRLRCRQQPGVECRRVGVFVHDLLALIENALDRVAFLAARGLAELLEDLLESLDLALGLVMMPFKRRPQLIRVGRLRHFRQGLQNLFFRVVDIFQRIEKKFVEVFSAMSFSNVGAR